MEAVVQAISPPAASLVLRQEPDRAVASLTEQWGYKRLAGPTFVCCQSDCSAVAFHRLAGIVEQGTQERLVGPVSVLTAGHVDKPGGLRGDGSHEMVGTWRGGVRK